MATTTCPIMTRQGYLVGCKVCPSCRSKDMWARRGRLAAEAFESAEVLFVTLTYGRDENGNKDHARTWDFFYADVQAFVATLRRRGERFRYFVCGERGTKRKRCHWHLLMFFDRLHDPKDWERQMRERQASGRRGRKLAMPIQGVPRGSSRFPKRLNIPQWKWGFTQVETCDGISAMSYITGYLSKDVMTERDKKSGAVQVMYRQSNCPVMGAKYITRKAFEHVKQGLPLRNFCYTVDGYWATKKGVDGVKYPGLRDFYISGRAQELIVFEMLYKYYSELNVSPRHPHKSSPWVDTEIVEKWEGKVFTEFGERVTRAFDKKDGTDFMVQRARKLLDNFEPSPKTKRKNAVPVASPPSGRRVYFSDRHNCWVAASSERGTRLKFWSMTENGYFAWADMIMPDNIVDAGKYVLPKNKAYSEAFSPWQPDELPPPGYKQQYDAERGVHVAVNLSCLGPRELYWTYGPDHDWPGWFREIGSVPEAVLRRAEARHARQLERLALLAGRSGGDLSAVKASRHSGIIGAAY